MSDVPQYNQERYVATIIIIVISEQLSNFVKALRERYLQTSHRTTLLSLPILNFKTTRVNPFLRPKWKEYSDEGKKKSFAA